MSDTGLIHIYEGRPGVWHVEDSGPYADTVGLRVYTTKQEAVRQGRQLARLLRYEVSVVGDAS